MPCDSGRSAYEESERIIRRKLDAVTQMLCWLCRVTEPEVIAMNPNLVAWWAAHQADDARREETLRLEVEAKRQRQEALAKLSPQERALLGLNTGRLEP